MKRSKEIKRNRLELFVDNKLKTEMSRQQALVSGNKLIETRRKQENVRRDMEASTANDRKSMLIASFENNTTQKIDRRQKEVKIECHY